MNRAAAPGSRRGAFTTRSGSSASIWARRSSSSHAGQFIGSQVLAGWTEDDGTLVVLMGNRSAFDTRRIAARVVAAARAGAPTAADAAP